MSQELPHITSKLDALEQYHFVFVMNFLSSLSNLHISCN